MTAFSITINGTSYGLVSRYHIPVWLEQEYIESDATIRHPEGFVSKYVTDYCICCERKFEMATKPIKCLSHNITINRYYGCPVVVCVDCRYYIEYIIEGSDSIPQSIRDTIDNGFVPKNINTYF